jgi:hypothetical protein
MVVDEKKEQAGWWVKWVGLGWLFGLVVLGFGVVGGLVWGLGQPDWRSFFPETRYFWQYRCIPEDTYMFGYLPAGFFIFWPFTVWPGPRLGVAVFVVLNTCAAAGSLWVLYRSWLKGANSRELFGWLLLLVSVPFAQTLRMSQLTIWVLFLSVAGLWLTSGSGKGRAWLGGLVLGLAGVIKILPFGLAGYLICRRQWRGLAGMGAAVVLFEVIPATIFLGWSGMQESHRAWRGQVAKRSNGGQIQDPFLSGVYRNRGNFSYAAVLSRWLRARPAGVTSQVILLGEVPKGVVERVKKELRPNEWLTLDPVGPQEGTWEIRKENLRKIPLFHLMNLSARTVWWVWALSLGGLIGGVGVWTWRGKGEEWTRAGSVWILGLFFLTPLMMNYYLALGAPAVAVLYDDILQGVRGRSWALKIIGLAGWVLGVVLMGWRDLRWFGFHYLVFGILIAGIMIGKKEVRERSEVQA